MTARQILPESRRRPVYAAVALVLVMVAVLLASGCLDIEGQHILHDQDIQISKIDQNGSILWMKLFDSGKQDFVEDIVQTTDGGVVIAGAIKTARCGEGGISDYDYGSPRLTKISGDGEILWERDYPENNEGLVSVIQNPDGSYDTVTNYGNILSVDSEGNLIKKYSSVIHTPFDTRQPVSTFIKTEDSGFVLAGESVTKIDSTGNLSWQRTYQNKFHGSTGAISIREIQEHHKYLVLVPPFAIIQLDQNGSVMNEIILPMFRASQRPRIQQVPDGYSIIVHHNFLVSNAYEKNEPVAIQINKSGYAIHNFTLVNASSIVFPESDGGFVSFKNVGSGEGILQITKINADGTIAGLQQQKCPNRCPEYYNVITINNREFFIAGEVRSQRTC